MKTYPRTDLPVFAAEMRRRQARILRWQMTAVLLGLLGMFGVCLFAGLSAVNSTSVKSVAPDLPVMDVLPDWKRDHSIHAYNLAADVVRETLRSPSTARFPGSLEKKEHVTTRMLSYGIEYKVESWVDSQNAFGATVRTHWTIYVVNDDLGWRVSAMDFIQK